MRLESRSRWGVARGQEEEMRVEEACGRECGLGMQGGSNIVVTVSSKRLSKG